ncbi:MAG: sigma-70 family RNA polymerase sigma factor [Saprospiraceae bacterium]|nr:sigma-70 family RNA polymerase sigma factor [Saprospiraceae bacterium]
MMISTHQEKEWIAAWPTRKREVMESLYKTCFGPLWTTAFRILRDEALAEDMVQEVMIRVWQMESLDHIATSLSGYLHRGVLNRSLNKLRELRRWDQDPQAPDPIASGTGGFGPDATHLEKLIAEAISALPDRCRLVFVLSRYEYLSYQEIAELLEISLKTVENQMSKALRSLREQLIKTKNNTSLDNQPTN